MLPLVQSKIAYIQEAHSDVPSQAPPAKQKPYSFIQLYNSNRIETGLRSTYAGPEYIIGLLQMQNLHGFCFQVTPLPPELIESREKKQLEPIPEFR